MKQHWLVYGWTGGGWYGDDTPIHALFSTTDGEKLHWGGNLQHMTRTEDMKVLHDYGWIDDMDNKAEEAMFADYDQRFPLEPHDIDRAVAKDISGFLAPNGEVYRSHYMGHTQLAEDLNKQFKIDVEQAYYGSRQVQALLKAGWLELCPGYVAFESDNETWATPEQVETLRRLHELNADWPKYREGIQEFLERLERYA